MDLGIHGKIALVCGASRGIAFATAEELAREGCTLVICSRDAASVGNAKAKLEALGASVTAIVADLATEAGIAEVIAQTMSTHGRVDILVANTGGPPTGGHVAFVGGVDRRQRAAAAQCGRTDAGVRARHA